MKGAALGLTVVVALSNGLFGCGGASANHDGGGGQGGGIAGGAGGQAGAGGGTGGTSGAAGTGGTSGAAGSGGTSGAAGSGGTSGAAGSGGISGAAGSGGSTAGTGGRTVGSGGGGDAGGGSGGAGATGSAGAAGRGGGAAGSGGAGGGGSTCDGTAPCGGNLVGTWNFVSVCLNDAALMEGFMVANCPEASIGDVTATRTGSVVFTATDYAAAGTLSISYTMALPASCIESGAPCSDLGDMLAASANVESAYCTGDTTCVCPIVTRPSSGSESGTYTTAGSMLNLSPASGTPSSVSYCVQGDRVHLLNTETISDMGALKMRTRSDQVAQRQ